MKYFKIVAGLSPVLATTTAGDCSSSTLREAYVVRSECHATTNPNAFLEFFWMIRSTVFVDMEKRYCGCLGSAFRYFLIALIVSVVGMTRRHRSFFSSQILMTPRLKSTSLVRIPTTSETRRPTERPKRMRASSWMLSMDQRMARICASVSERLRSRFLFRIVIARVLR